MKEDLSKAFIFGALAGVALMLAPWWISLAVVAGIAYKIWNDKQNHDDPTQAQALEEGPEKKETAFIHDTGSYSHSDFPEGECTWDFM